MPSFCTKLAHWETLNANLKLLLAEMPVLEKEQAQFDRLLAEARALWARQQDEEAALRETVRRRLELEQETKELGKVLVRVASCKLDPARRRTVRLEITPPRRKRSSPEAARTRT